MRLDASGYYPPIMCNATGCDQKAVFEDYVQRADGAVSLELRLRDEHKTEMDENGSITTRGA
jgi:hypothetical protein